jgi:putative membrane protein
VKSFIIGTLATALTFAIVSYILPAIDYGGDITGLVIVSLIAGVVNGLLKPILKAISLPLSMMTLGLFGLVINAALLLLIAWLSDLIGITFTIGDFPPDFSINTLTTALIGGIAISVVGTLVGMAVRD